MNKMSNISIILFKKFTLYFNKQNLYCKAKPGKCIPMFGFLWYFTKKEKSNEDKIINITKEADELFNNENYLEAYNLLSSYNKMNNSEIDWRLCRVLYKMSRTDIYDKQSKRSMILEAYDLISNAIKNNESDANVHKWMAILLDSKLRSESIFFRIEDKIRIKNHLIEANKLNPNDFSVLHMLGQWHYAVCSLTWLQRTLATFVFNVHLNCNYEDALNYFFKAEELKPRFYISNIYMLGKINYEMGNMYRAHYYLAIASQMTANTNQEKECVVSARNLVVKLKNFDVSEDAL